MNKRTGQADLHVHTTHSDGSCSPGEVVRAAANVGLSSLAITDHDTISALAIARPEADRLGVELIAGVELTTEHEGREYHVLGYFFRGNDPEMIETCRNMREKREARIRAMTERLSELGLRVDLAALGAIYPRATIGRRHLADWLVRSGQVQTRREAFAEYLGDDGPAHVPKPRLPIAEAFALIKRAGGVAALAHPPYDLRERTLEMFVGWGMNALEVDGHGVKSVRHQRLVTWANVYNLIPVAGSDFHSNDRPGRWVGSITTRAANVSRLRESRTSSPSLPSTDDHGD